MSLISEIMSPLSKDHCMIFYYLGFICFFLSITTICFTIIIFFNNKNKMPGLLLLSQSIMYILGYYIYRILYSICIKTI